VFEPGPSSGRGKTGKQLVNLAVEGVEESLSILPDYIPTVRPSPAQALLTMLTETCCTQRLTCSRTATVVCMVSGVD
jgi:hypothetical protein